MSESRNGEAKESKNPVEKYVQAVVRRKVYGKLPAETEINGTTINRLSVGKFYDHGPDQMGFSTLEDNVAGLHSQLFILQGKLPNLLINSHIVSVTPPKIESGNMVLTIRFFQDRKAPNSNNMYTTAYVQIELPGDVMNELIAKVIENPDLLEEFYQKVFVGLDSKGERPGMRRAQADGFYLITDLDLIKAGRARGQEMIGRFFQKLERYRYTNGPYGSGDVFTF